MCWWVCRPDAFSHKKIKLTLPSMWLAFHSFFSSFTLAIVTTNNTSRNYSSARREMNKKKIAMDVSSHQFYVFVSGKRRKTKRRKQRGKKNKSESNLISFLYNCHAVTTAFCQHLCNGKIACYHSHCFYTFCFLFIAHTSKNHQNAWEILHAIASYSSTVVHNGEYE